jgi:hypothetical protein
LDHPKFFQNPHWDVFWPILGPYASCLILSPESSFFSVIRHGPNIHWTMPPKWPLNGTFNPNILRDLYNFCEHAGKWKELPYAQSFLYLHTKPSLCTSCSPVQVLIASKPASKQT